MSGHGGVDAVWCGFCLRFVTGGYAFHVQRHISANRIPSGLIVSLIEREVEGERE